jgi:hypothetical protein
VKAEAAAMKRECWDAPGRPTAAAVAVAEAAVAEAAVDTLQRWWECDPAAAAAEKKRMRRKKRRKKSC